MNKIILSAFFIFSCVHAQDVPLNEFDINYLPENIIGKATFISESEVSLQFKACNTLRYSFKRTSKGWSQDGLGISTRKICLNDQRDQWVDYFIDGIYDIDKLTITSRHKEYPLTLHVKMY